MTDNEDQSTTHKKKHKMQEKLDTLHQGWKAHKLEKKWLMRGHGARCSFIRATPSKYMIDKIKLRMSKMPTFSQKSFP